ncbi:MAG: hypothetical protein ACRDM7_10455 [Thermoleophilaceae bacterium]
MRTAGGAAAATADPAQTGAQLGGSRASLPFTGSELALLAAIGLLGVAGGLALRRLTRRLTRAGA